MIIKASVVVCMVSFSVLQGFCLKRSLPLGYPSNVSFNASMGKYSAREGLHEFMKILQSLYIKNNLFTYLKTNKQFLQQQPRIPKIIHAIWLGSPPPESVLKNFKSFKKHHPSWECKLWDDEDIKNLGLHNQQFYDLSKNYGQRSDIARYEILYRYGGVYVDSDFKCLRPFDILHQYYDFYTGVLKIGKRCVGLANGLIASVPGHPILKRCIETMQVAPQEGKKEITKTTGPGHFTRSFLAVIASCVDHAIVFPSSFFYPAPNTKRHQTIQKMDGYIKPETFAIHYWTNSWKEPEALVKRKRKKWRWKK